MTLSDLGLTRWGPSVSDDARLRSEQAVRLVAKRFALPIDVVADVMLECAIGRRYLLLERLAKTRRATVHAAVDLLLAREVAIKVHDDDDPEVVLRALAEARAMARVDHPNLVRVHDLGEHGGRMFAVMELCDGNLERGRVGNRWEVIVERILEAGAGLRALHDAGLVHADIKPANILIRHGTAKLSDLGLAGEPELVYRISGTVGFIAPEVADGHRSQAGDVFALACTAWVCLFGELPFGEPPAGASASSGVMVLAERARTDEVIMPSSLPRGMPRAVLAVLRTGLRGDAQHRPDLQAWLAALRRAANKKGLIPWVRRQHPATV